MGTELIKKCFCSGKHEAAPAGAKPVIKIGMILPLTGRNASYGDGAFKAAKLAFDEATENAKYAYEVVVGDDQLSSTLTYNIMKEMVATNAIDAVITFFSSAGLAK